MGLKAKIRPVRAAADAVPYSKERREAAIKSGGIPLDCQPDYLPFLFRGFVDLDNPLPRLLCELFPERREWYTDAWCRLAQTDAIAWDETWRWIDGLVATGLDVPDRLRCFAFVPLPHRGRGRTSKEAWSLRFEYLVAALVDEGFDEGELWDLYAKCFPNELAKDPRNSYRTLRRKRSSWLAGPDPGETETDSGSGGRSPAVHAPPQLPSDGDWADRVAATRSVLTGDCSPFLLAWHFWGERCTPYLELWCVLAKERGRAWVWDGLRELLSWMVYWNQEIPPPLRRFARAPRPKNPMHRMREDARRLRVALVAHKLEELGYGEAGIRETIVDALGESTQGVEETTVDTLLADGRELIRDFLLIQGASGPLPWEA